jgi:hypothetical protein
VRESNRHYLRVLVANVSVIFSLGLLIDKPIQQNDDCTDADTITAGVPMSGTTIGATFDGLDECGTAITAPGVWYTIVGEGGMVFIASTCDAATYDTKISVFSGTCGDLDCVAGNDDTPGCSDFTSEIGFPTTDGTDYFILVHGFSGDIGDFILTVTSFPAPDVSARIE